MYLSKEDLEKIQAILDKFPEVSVFELKEEGNNGIGTVITMEFDHTHNGVTGKMIVEISGVENW